MAVYGPYEYPKYYLGLSTDTKPTTVSPGDEFFETDTRLTYIYSGSAWGQKVSAASGPDVYKTLTDPALNAAVTQAIVDAYSGSLITLTAAGNAQTIASPTIITAGKRFTIVNNDTSTNSIVVNGFTVTPGEAQSFVWDGTAWGPIDIGITSLPVIVSQGGTGLTTITDHGVLLGSGTGAVTPMAVLATGAMLVGVTGADPTSVSPNITTTKKFLTETGTGAVGATPVFDTIASADIATALETAPKITMAEALNLAYVTVASHATTSAIWAAAGNVINFTGAETITDLPAAPQAGAQRTLICAGACVWTHGGNLTVQGAASRTCVSGDVVIVTAITTTTFRINFIAQTETGTGSTVRDNSPTLVGPALGTPASGTLTNCTGLPQAGTVGLTTADSPVFATVKLSGLTDLKVPKHVDDTTGLADTTITVSANNEVTNASQPAFLAVADGTQTNIATAGNIDVVFATEVYDQNVDFASPSFTAPVTGKYHFDVLLYLQNVDTATRYFLSLVASNRTLTLDAKDFTQMAAGDLIEWCMGSGTDIDMDAADTAKVVIYQNGGTAQTDIGADSRFSGHLVC